MGVGGGGVFLKLMTQCLCHLHFKTILNIYICPTVKGKEVFGSFHPSTFGFRLRNEPLRLIGLWVCKRKCCCWHNATKSPHQSSRRDMSYSRCHSGVIDQYIEGATVHNASAVTHSCYWSHPCFPAMSTWLLWKGLLATSESWRCFLFTFWI